MDGVPHHLVFDGGPFGVWLLGSEGVPSWFERVMLTGFYAGRKQQLRM
jgi:hypothetical protein